MKFSFDTMSFFVFYGVIIFFVGRMLRLAENINVATPESRAFTAIERIGNMLVWLAHIIEFRARQIFLHDVCESSSRAAAKKKQYRHQSHGLILA